jgi:phage tail sheath protein FI
MIPRVKLSVSEDTTRYYTTSVDFVPVIIMKTMSGDIGTRQIIRSESEFISKFGKGTVDTPAAYAIQTYLRTYSFIYVTRVASSNAAYGTTKLTVKDAEDKNIDLLSFKTAYKTASFNGTEIKLVYDEETKKLYVTTILNSSTVTSVKQTIDLTTAKANELSEALDKIVTSINAMNLGFKATNLFTNKVDADTMPVIELENLCTVAEGDSGLTDIKNSDVITAINEYASSDIQIDILITPEFTDVEVITAGVKAAEDYGFMYIASPSSNDYTTAITEVISYPKSESLAVYWPNVKYSNFDTVIPASVAVLTAYAKNDNINKWLSPAGINRGLLSLVTDLDIPASLSEEEMSDLYDNIIPINVIKYVPNSGYAVWGQKTTATSDVYMDRINVARLVKYVYREVYNISTEFLFEPINESTYTNWGIRVSSLLENIKTNQGIIDYKYKMDSENNTEATIAENYLIGQVSVRPTEVAEFIDIDFVLTSEV